MKWNCYINRKGSETICEILDLPGTCRVDTSYACLEAAKKFNVKEDDILCVPFLNDGDKISCGIPGYSMTAQAYGKMIQEYTDKGEFVVAKHYIDKAENAGVLERIRMAFQGKIK